MNVLAPNQMSKVHGGVLPAAEVAITISLGVAAGGVAAAVVLPPIVGDALGRLHGIGRPTARQLIQEQIGNGNLGAADLVPGAQPLDRPLPRRQGPRLE
jgi:hypothetical protein